MSRIFCLILGSLLAVTAAAADYQIIGTATTQSGSLTRVEATVQVGSDPLDQFKMVRVFKDLPGGASRGAILLLPPAGFTFTFYEQRDRPGPRGAGVSFAELFARRGYDVYGYSPRMEGVVAGCCEAGALDCSGMAAWDIQSIVDDVAFLRQWIELQNPKAGVVVGGLSLGAMSAIASVNAYPGDYDGLIVWEGMLYSEDPAVVGLSSAYCPALQAALDAGILFDGVNLNVLKSLGQYVQNTPAGLTPIALFPPFFSNHLALVAALSVPTDGPFSQPVPGYILAAGSVADDRMAFADDTRLVDSALRLYNYLPIAMVRDLHCSLAGLDDRYVADLGDFTGPILALGAGHGYGPYMQDQLDRFGSSDVTMRYQPDFGHVDHFWSPRHRALLEFPILRWLRGVLP